MITIDSGRLTDEQRAKLEHDVSTGALIRLRALSPHDNAMCTVYAPSLDDWRAYDAGMRQAIAFYS